ncbi:hypothetical protein K9U39_05035 [Rhodoblastus acidophilus]|uniref:Sulfur globule protein n=1 Tax=Candidatus Rhodoblastus alkanivorans TaxID=2954117 RepID=A0ABS9Z5V4_9HYPH|nr:hypothetical protein [Candidatus Rhodoblastus alkanivorans]MCI4678596.1 hypothetical protein [Candidatus Rhodoblastus alkanivorans]MCI4683006.1 hypothetical protein [Candidatus Rhodoblastus alkanivorans]MDI4640316.1 hypothetical protein [Rhodoblastus acidophilus]
MKTMLSGALIALGLTLALPAGAMPLAPSSGVVAGQSEAMITQVHGYYGRQGRHGGWSRGHHYGWGRGHGYGHGYRYGHGHGYGRGRY